MAQKREDKTKTAMQISSAFPNQRTQFSKNEIAVKLEASVSEKLGRKRAIADKLDEKQKALRSKFNDKLEIVQRIKEDFRTKEDKLFQSVKNVGEYIRNIQSLKKEADNMYKVFIVENNEINLDFFKLIGEHSQLLERKELIVEFVGSLQLYKKHLEKIISDLPQYQNEKELVDYYLVLKMLHEDLLTKEAKTREKLEHHFIKKQNMDVDSKNLPIKVLEKENILYNLEADIKYVNENMTQLKQELDKIISEKTKKDIEWHDTERWISKLYDLCCQKLPLISEDNPKDIDSPLLQLETIKDFVYMGTEITKRITK